MIQQSLILVLVETWIFHPHTFDAHPYEISQNSEQTVRSVLHVTTALFAATRRQRLSSF